MSDTLPRFTSYPLTLYHPVLGAVTVEDQDAAAKTFVPEHDWYRTPEEADAHRTEREAQMVVHNTRRMQIDDIASDGDTVAHSVAHTERVMKPLEEAQVSPEEQEQRNADELRRDDERREQIEAQRASDEAHVVVDQPTHTEAG